MNRRVCQLCAVDFTLRNFLLPLVDGMQARGWEVTAVCSNGPYTEELRARGYRVTNIPIARSMNPISALRSIWLLWRYFRREQFDIVHVHTPVAALVGRIAAVLAGTSLVIYTAHGFYFHEGMPAWKRKIFVLLERFGGAMTDLLFSQSREDAEDAVHEGIATTRNVLTIGNGVDVERFDPEKVGNQSALRGQLGIPENAFVIGMIGRQVREKGIVEFLQAAEMAAARDGNIYFLLIGERLDSDHAAGVQAEFERARQQLGARLVAPGLRRDIPQLLAAMDLFCLPSWREGMPRTIIEAMMMERPVLATDIRGAREEVVAGETGLLVPVRNERALAEAMLRLATDRELSRRMGESGRRRALDLYDERKVVALQLERIEAELKLMPLSRR